MKLRHSPRRIKPILLLTLSAALALTAACGKKDEPEATGSPTPSAWATESALPLETPTPEPTPAFVAPLTGLPIEEAPALRPLSVMINNYGAARPQSGLTYADTVWEILAEGGITRLLAIFHSQTTEEPLGPIRSIRPYLIDIGETYGGVLVHAGASNDALAILQHSGKADLDEINNAGSFFYRDKSRKAPHNLYATMERLREGVRKLKFDETASVPGLRFADEPAAAGASPATQVTAKFTLESYKVSYAYDAASGLYLRSINGEPHIDKNNDKQLSATNLVFLSASHRVYDSEGRLEIDLMSGGEAMLIQRGQVVRCTWERKAGDIPRLMRNGAELPFVPGVTYYHVIPGKLDSHVELS